MSPYDWFCANFVMGLIAFSLAFFFAWIFENLECATVLSLVIILSTSLGFMWLWGICVTAVRRLHDMGAPGALILPGVIALVASLVEAILREFAADGTVVIVESGWSRIINIIVVVVGFCVMLIPGDPKENKYGAPSV